MFALTCNTEIEVNMSLNWLKAHGVQSPFTKCHQRGAETLQNAMSSEYQPAALKNVSTAVQASSLNDGRPGLNAGTQLYLWAPASAQPELRAA
jgi:hypothetical protein